MQEGQQYVQLDLRQAWDWRRDSYELYRTIKVANGTREGSAAFHLYVPGALVSDKTGPGMPCVIYLPPGPSQVGDYLRVSGVVTERNILKDDLQQPTGQHEFVVAVSAFVTAAQMTYGEEYSVDGSHSKPEGGD